MLVPPRFLFIASIGNKAPYRTTRHSAGHALLEAVEPLLARRVPLVTTTKPKSSPIPIPILGRKKPQPVPVFYQTWFSPTFMNVSGPKLVRTLDDFLAEKREVYRQLRQGQVEIQVQRTDEDGSVESSDKKKNRDGWTRRGIDPRALKRFNPTLVILHDELEAPLGKLRVKRGGPEQASLRGHRGLISVMESLRGRGMLPGQNQIQNQNQDQSEDESSPLSILRIGVGIGRPASRQREDVAEYVLTEMSPAEMEAVRAAAGPAVDVLADEFYRKED